MNSSSRITGLASGIDTETIINDLMKAERVKLDEVQQEKQLLVWKQEIYNSLNKDYANFILNTKKDLGLVSTTSTGSYVSNSYDNLTWVKKAISSNENIAKVSATAKSVNGIYNVNVKNLAEGVSLVSTGEISKDENGIKRDVTNLKQLGVNIGENEEKRVTVTTSNGSVTFKFVNSGEKVKVDKDNNIVSININEANLSDLAKAVSDAKVYSEDGKDQKSLGVKANYDSTIDRFFFQTSDTGSKNFLKVEEATVEVGEDGKITVVDGTGKNLFVGSENLLKVAGKDEDNQTFYLSNGIKREGKDAEISFNGAENILLSSNQFTINGIDFNLIDEGSFTVTVDTDVDSVYEKIQKFVDSYNELVEKTSNLLTEKKYRDYQPLTDDQKSDMKEDDIKLWEDKAKSGLLRSDGTLESTMSNMRGWLYNTIEGVSGSFDFIADIGITTESYSQGSVGGKLTIDETKLKDALRKDTNGVLEVLFKEPDYSSEALKGTNAYMQESQMTKEQIEAKRKQSGIVTRVYDSLIQGMGDIVLKSGTGDEADLYRKVKSNMLIDFVTKYGSISTIDEDVLDLDQKIYDLNQYLSDKEESYYTKFTAMEKAIASMSSQSSWLTQQFSQQ
ncbi:flagellar filament capping protein FliD [Sporanaerobacter sp. PP17-6a]|jgi:flagellar hook-associated protein 2|uniref:flagellar filament capping protein FliD n=1 Tax=Sporanaerobacter sp. PP17-6a TaxID=1891289 RepID=UPI0008A084C5|nr:flagellar filament capping protein FliD [Sporanaerobacter sp. PP17-6a]SCL87499.1 Flagellar cap protein [Sporanaerobacter sp. PP17-6a]